MVDNETFMNLACIILFLNTMKILIKFAQAWDVFVIYLVQIIKMAYVELYEMFWIFLLLLSLTHLYIYISNFFWKVNMKWFWWDGLHIWILALITWHLNIKQTTFGHKLRILIQGWNVKCYTTRNIFEAVVASVKLQW